MLTLLRVAPIRVTCGTTSVVVVPEEPVELPSGEAVYLTVDLPRLKTFRAEDAVPEGERGTLWLDTDGLLTELAGRKVLTAKPHSLLPRSSGGDLPPGQSAVKSVTVDIGRGLQRLAPIAASLAPRRAALAATDSAVAISGSRPVSLSAKVAGRKILPRVMMVPYAGLEANECLIVPVTPVGASARLRVEPADPVAALLMDYLIAGKFVLACAAARAIENYRGGVDPAEWTHPSYCQLLIGYAYALGRDAERLDRWCRRTDAPHSLGTDGLVLAAEAARLQLDPARSAGIIERAAGAPAPLLVHGADIGLRVAGMLLAGAAATASAASKSRSWIPSRSQEARLRLVSEEFSRLLFTADTQSSSLSVPTATDPNAALNPSRIRYTIRRILSGTIPNWRRRYPVAFKHKTPRRQYLVGAAMTDTSTVSTAGSAQASQQDGGGQGAGPATPGGSTGTPKLAGPALWTAVAALVVWVAFSAILLLDISKNETEWTRIAWVFGSIQSVAFAAAGALFGTAVQQQNVSTAQQQAATARQDADQQRETAAKGRALAAVMQAEGTAAEASDPSGLKAMGPGGVPVAESTDALRQRHAHVSRILFGNLTEPHSS